MKEQPHTPRRASHESAGSGRIQHSAGRTGSLPLGSKSSGATFVAAKGVVQATRCALAKSLLSVRGSHRPGQPQDACWLGLDPTLGKRRPLPLAPRKRARLKGRSRRLVLGTGATSSGHLLTTASPPGVAVTASSSRSPSRRRSADAGRLAGFRIGRQTSGLPSTDRHSPCPHKRTRCAEWASLPLWGLPRSSWKFAVAAVRV